MVELNISFFNIGSLTYDKLAVCKMTFNSDILVFAETFRSDSDMLGFELTTNFFMLIENLSILNLNAIVVALPLPYMWNAEYVNFVSR